MSQTFVAEGHFATLAVTPTKVIISRKGILNAMSGMRGEKEMVIRSISSVQIKPSTIVTQGYIELSFMGGQESKRRGVISATNNENAVVFRHGQQHDFIKAKQLIEEYQQTMLSEAAATSAAPPSISDELEKLASLREEGIPTDDEFQKLKQKLIGK